jgi:dimeric dUTPase (all-alpha-NTP-PPase superfamily)
MADKLDSIFEEQGKLNKHIRETKKSQGLGYEFSEKEWIDKLTTAMIEEAMEIKAHSNWKWWKKPKDLGREDLKEEIVDLLHFWVALCLRLGISAEEIYDKYMEKNRENMSRQDKGHKSGHEGNDY